MNENRGRRPLRTTLAVWLRAIFRRTRPEPDPEQTVNAGRQGAGAAAPGQEDTSLPEISPGERSGPPEHWLALAESKGPPQHWLDLIRTRLGGDLSKVRWMRGRALPPQAKDAAPRLVQALPVKEVKPAPPSSEHDIATPGDEEKKVTFPPETGLGSQADVENRPASSAERRPLAAMRLYPARAEPPLPAALPRSAPLAQSQPSAENKSRRQSAPQPDLPARPRPISLTDGRAPQPAEGPKPRTLPLAPASEGPVSGPSPVPPALLRAAKAEERPAQTKPEPVPREQEMPQDEAWPAWQGPTLAAPEIVPEISGTAQKRSGPELPPPTRPDRRLPPVELHPQNPEQPGDPSAWPVPGEPAQAARDLPANPAPAERWPALEPAADDDLAGDDWENYQRDWQRLERLRREQQGQIWSEWPF